MAVHAIGDWSLATLHFIVVDGYAMVGVNHKVSVTVLYYSTFYLDW